MLGLLKQGEHCALQSCLVPGWLLHSWLHVPCTQVETRSLMCPVELACWSI